MHRTPAPGRTRRRGSRLRTALALALAAAGLSLFAPTAAYGATITTDYPDITVQPGQTTTFNLAVASPAHERVALSVASKPKGWTAHIRGDDALIGAVGVSPGSSPDVQVAVAVPAKAKPGTHKVVIDADAPSGSDQLTLDLNVVKASTGALKLTSKFPKLQGSSDDTFTFSAEVQNTGGRAATLNLTAKGPKGWNVNASPQAKDKASTIDVDADGSAAIKVTADPPDNVSAGSYPIEVQAQGAEQSLTTKLTAEVTGSAQLTVSTPSQRLNASGGAGRTSDVNLVVTNSGNTPLKNVSMSATPPSGWDVSFDPKTITSIDPGDTASVTMHTTPAGDAINGDYVLTAQASSDSGSASADIRYSVQTSTWWGLIGIVVIALAIVGLLWALRRYGRR